MRRRHDDPMHISSPLVVLVIREEACARVRVARPHGRPQEVCLEPEEKLKDLLVELDVVSAELLPHPPRQRRGFIVDEDAAVLDAGRTMDAGFMGGEDLGVVLWWHVGPPIPAWVGKSVLVHG